jgi:hypothetical protein
VESLEAALVTQQPDRQLAFWKGRRSREAKSESCAMKAAEDDRKGKGTAIFLKFDGNSKKGELCFLDRLCLTILTHADE